MTPKTAIGLTLSLFALTGTVAAQEVAADSARPPYSLFRWEENYQFLAGPANRTDFFDPVKYIRLNSDGSSYLTFSGQLREEALSFDAPLYGLKGSAKDNWWFHRLLLGADWHIDPSLRAFLELGNELAPGKRAPLSPSDQDRLNVQLAFLDYATDLGSGNLTVRGGRQEIVFDLTQRFLGVREGPNVRQAFDGGRATWDSKDVRLTVFEADPVNYSDAALLDDATDKNTHFGGVRAEWLQTPFLPGEVDTYVYHYSSSEAKLGAGLAYEEFSAPGVRYAGKALGFDWDVEAIGETGSIGPERLRAWAFGSLWGYTVATLPWQPRLGIQADVGSGDSNPKDGTDGTFNPLYTKGAYFTEAALTGYSNVEHLKPSVTLHPSHADELYVGVGLVHKQSANDYAYEAPFIPIPGSNVSTLKNVGFYDHLIYSHAFNRHLSLDIEAVHFVVSSSFRAIGAHDTNYSKVGLNFLF